MKKSSASVLSIITFFYSLLFYGHAGYNHLFSFCFDIIDFIFKGILAGLEGEGKESIENVFFKSPGVLSFSK